MSPDNVLDLLKKAEDSFSNREYKQAMTCYSQILSFHPEHREARTGILLCDIAMEHDDEAQALYDYYKVIKKEGDGEAEDTLESLIQGFDGSIEKITQFLIDSSIQKIQYFDGISYADFKIVINDRGGFNRAFEDLMYSTKIIISGKEDFLEFMNNLVDHGFSEIAMTYLEGVGENFIHDERIRGLAEKIQEIDKRENSGS